MIRLSRESMEAAFIKYLETVFEHPEIISAGVRNIAINRENIGEAGKRACAGVLLLMNASGENFLPKIQRIC